MRSLSVYGVWIGGIVDVGSSVILSVPLSVYAMTRVGLANAPKGQVGAAIARVMLANMALYNAALVIGLACSILGGYVAAWIAKRDEMLNGACSSVLCVALGIYSMAFGKDSHALWVQILMFVASPACGLLGGYWKGRQRQAIVQPA